MKNRESTVLRGRKKPPPRKEVFPRLLKYLNGGVLGKLRKCASFSATL